MYLTSNRIFTIRNETIYDKTQAVEKLTKPTAFVLCVCFTFIRLCTLCVPAKARRGCRVLQSQSYRWL